VKQKTAYGLLHVKRLTETPARANGCTMGSENEKADDLNFEEALKALEAIVHRLESGEAPLDESIALYERGNHLRGLCQKRLDAAKARIEAITLDKDGAPSGTKPFDAE